MPSHLYALRKANGTAVENYVVYPVFSPAGYF